MIIYSHKKWIRLRVSRFCIAYAAATVVLLVSTIVRLRLFPSLFFSFERNNSWTICSIFSNDMPFENYNFVMGFGVCRVKNSIKFNGISIYSCCWLWRCVRARCVHNRTAHCWRIFVRSFFSLGSCRLPNGRTRLQTDEVMLFRWKRYHNQFAQRFVAWYQSHVSNNRDRAWNQE